MSQKDVVLITGCSSGFGRYTAELLAESGYRVFATMRDVAGKNAPAAEALQNRAREQGYSLQVLELDVTDEESVNGAVETALRQAGKIDVAVNNAGIMAIGLLEGFTVDQAREMLEVNVLGPLRVNRAVLPSMRQRKSGLLIHISSIVGRILFPFLGAYTASKFALEALAEAYRYELARLGVDSVIIEPGAFLTRLAENAQQPADEDRVRAYGPVADVPRQMSENIGRQLTGPEAPDPREVARAVLRLIQTPPGKRPLRTVVDRHPQGVERINQVCEEVQHQVLDMMGLADLKTVHTVT